MLPEDHIASLSTQLEDAAATIQQSASYLSQYQALARELRIAILPGTLLEAMQRHDGGEADDDGSSNSQPL